MVNTRAFAICFYHVMRQAVYHALRIFVRIDNKKVQPKNPCLQIKWDNQSVSIYNRGNNVPENFKESNDRAFFDRFVEKTDEFCEKKRNR